MMYSFLKTAAHTALISCALLAIAPGSGATTAANRPATTISANEQALLKNKKYQQGLRDLENHLPLEASKHFQECLASEQLPNSQKAIIRPFLAEALIRANKTDEGLAAWAELPASPMKSYWVAVGLLNQGALTKALEELALIPDTDPLAIYASQLKARLARQLDDDGLLVASLDKLARAESPSISHPAGILLADTLANMHQYAEAATLLERIKTALAAQQKPSPLLPYADLVEGKLAIAQGNLNKAIAIFTAITTQTTYPDKMKDLGRLALARAEILLEKGTPAPTAAETRLPEDDDSLHATGTGEDRLLTFIGGKAESSLLMDALNILLAENTFRTNPQALEKLTGWVGTKDNIRQPAAMYAMGRILLDKQDLNGALQLAGEALAKHPYSAPVQTLCLNVITALLEQERTADAEKLIGNYPTKAPGIIFQQGALAFRKGDYPLAGKLFKEAADRGTEATTEAALFNANLAALHANDTAGTNALLQQAAGNTPLQERLLFEQAHYAAMRMMPHAPELLKRFLQIATHPALKNQALLDQGEVALNLNPPDTQTAQAVIPLLEAAQLPPAQALQLARLKILLAESTQDWPAAIQACRQAIAQDAEGSKADLLHLKLGELLYKNGDFHEAQLVLQPFPSKYPNSPLLPAALFLAGKAAQQSNTGNALDAALNIFRTLASGNTPFSQPARIEEASVLLRMGKADQCISTLDALLAQQLPRYMRLLALSIQADAWVTKADTNTDTLHKAVNLCTEILNTPNLGLAWKFKALTQRAQFYERLNDQEKALDDYASILMHTPTGDSANKRKDWHWFYNAGFASIRIMSQQQDWNTALAIAQKLARTSGPRAREAATYARRLRLEHFIWQEEEKQPAPPPPPPGHQPPHNLPFIHPAWNRSLPKKPGESTQPPSSWMQTATFFWARTTAATHTGISPREELRKMKASNTPWPGKCGKKLACAHRNTPSSTACRVCVTNIPPITGKSTAGSGRNKHTSSSAAKQAAPRRTCTAAPNLQKPNGSGCRTSNWKCSPNSKGR